MPQFGNVPGKMKMTDFDWRFLDDFARRVMVYAGESPVVWTIQDRKVPVARVTRKLS